MARHPIRRWRFTESFGRLHHRACVGLRFDKRKGDGIYTRKRRQGLFHFNHRLHHRQRLCFARHQPHRFLPADHQQHHLRVRCYGIYVTGDSAPLVAGNLITGNSRGIGIFSGAAGLYRANRIQGNTEYGIYNNNLSSFPNIDARNNWWGDAAGPKPTGAGDLVGSKVDYSPWATSITDSEPDGMWDEWEMTQFANLSTANATSDTDLDGLLDKDEFLYGTNPNNKDSDGDGVWDGREVTAGMNRLWPATSVSMAMTTGTATCERSSRARTRGMI